jgi:hypothetical protein
MAHPGPKFWQSGRTHFADHRQLLVFLGATPTLESLGMSLREFDNRPIGYF